MSQIESLLGARRSHHRGLELLWKRGLVRVGFPNGRSQSVRYELDGDMYRFRSTILLPAAAKSLDLDRLAVELLERNRTTRVVTFSLTGNGHVEAWIDQRASTLYPDELRFYLTTLAAEADRLEYLLSGKDVH